MIGKSPSNSTLEITVLIILFVYATRIAVSPFATRTLVDQFLVNRRLATHLRRSGGLS